MKALVIVLLFSLGSSAIADRAPKSRRTAVALSLGTTLGGVGVMLLSIPVHLRSPGDPIDKPEVVTIVGLGAAAFAIGPTLGHVYAGSTWNRGLAYRLAGAGVGAAGLWLGASVHCGVGQACERGSTAKVAGTLLLTTTGAIFYGVGMVKEIHGAAGAVERYNASIAITPTPLATRDGMTPGLAIAGRF